MKTFQTIPRSRLHRWNCRQRKKLRIGEFQELGFTLYLRFNAPLDEPAYDLLWDALIEQIERLGLSVGGLGGRLPITETEGFISAWEKGSVQPAQVNSLLEWCRVRTEVKAAYASELVDAWHSWKMCER